MSSIGATTEYVTSRDGTRIGFLRQGSGPGIVLVQGAMADATAYRELASHLADSFTVLSADRRGRGLSARPFSPDHRIARDVEDVDAILAATGARTVFGLSSGAVIALEAARTLPRIEQAIVFEPPFYRDGIDRAGIRRLNAEIERGDLPGALLDSLLIAGTAPAILRRAPRPLARLVAAIVIAIDGRLRGSSSSFRGLLPGVRYDFADVEQIDDDIDRFGDVHKPVLLLSGTASPTFLHDAVDDLGRVLPAAQHVQLQGLGHDGPWNRGAPAEVAASVRNFCCSNHADHR